MQKQQKPPQNLDTVHIESVVSNWYSFHAAEVVHDQRKAVKITSLYECASQLASKVYSVNLLLIEGKKIMALFPVISCPSDNKS
jgi:hypothetical protein